MVGEIRDVLLDYAYAAARTRALLPDLVRTIDNLNGHVIRRELLADEPKDGDARDDAPRCHWHPRTSP